MSETIATYEASILDTMDLVAEFGVARAHRWLDARELDILQRELHQLYYERHQVDHKNVTEDILKPRTLTAGAEEALGWLRVKIGESVRSCGERYPSLINWRPTDTVIQKYTADSQISSHRDESKYMGVILILSISGEAMFRAGASRSAADFEWRVGPGDLLVLRSEGLIDMNKDKSRLFHSISGALGDEDRISIGFRDRGE